MDVATVGDVEELLDEKDDLELFVEDNPRCGPFGTTAEA
eukprot:SAG11_NODE_4573_length_1846_cov_0.831712_2_plen_39_part_00